MLLLNRFLPLFTVNSVLSLFFIVGLIFNVSSALAQNKTIELESTFKGNQEQPKVLYIVPWQKVAAPEAFYQPLESLVDESFELLDRDEFRRVIKFKRQLNP
ncbi:MAG: hypothetical protein QMC22_03980 [Pseudomonadales bacterium]|mgnify:FL=1|tara:strand:+ start:1888 stop:2193 length:306 start_codon:yes stop_codon:yes gene_type:complete